MIETPVRHLIDWEPMTHRSEQRAREMAIIDAAVRWHRGVATEWRTDDGRKVANALLLATDAYIQHGLAEATGTPTRYTAPKTSHEAAKWLSERVDKPLGKIFAAILAANGLTVDQLEQRLSMSHQTASARVNQLRDQGYLINSGETRPTRSGRQAVVWRASALARAAAREVPQWGWPPMAPCEKEG